MDSNVEIKKLEMKNKLLERENRQLKIKLKQIRRILK